MSKIIPGTCVGGVVKFGDQVVEAEVLSQGTESSEGLIVLDGPTATYLTSNASDISDLIDALDGILQKVIQIATSLDAVTVSPGTAAANIALLTTLNTQLALTKDNLK